MERACTDVQKGLSIRRVELENGIPKSTTHDYACGNHMIGNSGHWRYLSNELVKFLIGCADVGYARSRKQIIATVESYSLNVKIHLLMGGGRNLEQGTSTYSANC